VLVDLGDPALAPEQWRTALPPALGNPVDQVIYELHLRDFSISDASVPAELRGSFLAPTVDSAGMAHLRRLAEAGLNTVQLLPLFDNATVEEHPEQQVLPPKEQLRSLPPDSPEQQRHVRELGGRSGFNWGYDPWHYFTPEEMAYVLDSLTPREASEFLIEKARSRAKGSGDNISLAIVRIEDF
jgi:pullulanase/glycogen debranching enzyme